MKREIFKCNFDVTQISWINNSTTSHSWNLGQRPQQESWNWQRSSWMTQSLIGCKFGKGFWLNFLRFPERKTINYNSFWKSLKCSSTKTTLLMFSITSLEGMAIIQNMFSHTSWFFQISLLIPRTKSFNSFWINWLKATWEPK